MSFVCEVDVGNRVVPSTWSGVLALLKNYATAMIIQAFADVTKHRIIIVTENGVRVSCRYCFRKRLYFVTFPIRISSINKILTEQYLMHDKNYIKVIEPADVSLGTIYLGHGGRPSHYVALRPSTVSTTPVITNFFGSCDNNITLFGDLEFQNLRSVYFDHYVNFKNCVLDHDQK